MEVLPLPQNKSNRIYICAAIIVALIQFFIFKYLYPFPNFLPDSYNYLRSASQNMNANLWPVGYSKLISLVGFFSHTDTVLIFVQYAIYIASALYFFFTFTDILDSGKWIKIVLFAFLFLNPIFIFISNYVSSDILFTSLSLIWITQLFRIIKTPTTLLLAAHILVLLFAFSVRYNALFYPMISIIVILFARLPKSGKSFSIVAIVLTIATFMMYTSNENKRLFGTQQFSAFGGWQLASNALIGYEHVNNRQPAPEKFTALHTLVNTYLDSLNRSFNEKIKENGSLNANYLWREQAPLQRYSRAIAPSREKRMAAVAPLYKDYGAFLIMRHPGAFFNYYLLPNTKQYFFPRPEFLAMYNQRKSTVKDEAVKWFRYKSDAVYNRTGTNKVKLFDYYPVLIVCTTLLFLLGTLLFFAKQWYVYTSNQFRSALLITLLFWVANLVFSVFASPIVLRYQLFTMALTFAFTLPLVDFFLRADSPPATPQLKEEDAGDTALQPL